MAALLEMRGVSKKFNAGGGLFKQKTTTALQDFSLTIQDDRPTVIAIAGESGSGKTTLANLLLGIIEPTTGEIRYQGKDLQEMDKRERKLFRQQVQAIFQDPFGVYNPFYKVDHVLTTPISKFGLARTKAEARKKIEDVLEKVGLRPEETLGRYPHQLSGGQRQRIMIARALLLNPRIILADEPVSMVDASLRATILESLLQLHRELGISLIYITHDLTTAYQLCESIIILYQGSVAEIGDVEMVIKDPRHPYTQLLVGSIPLPDPDSRWGNEGDQIQAEASETNSVDSGCHFANRCPFVMDKCRETQPALHLVDQRRAAACHLYEQAPTVTSAEVMNEIVSSR